jgi:hypothetical protein
MELTEHDVAEATRRGIRAHQSLPPIKSVRCTTKALSITFASGMELRIPTRLIQGLAGAAAAHLQDIEVSPMGTGLHFPALDADVYLPGLLQGVFGTQAWMRATAAEMGRQGGLATTTAKRRAAQRNGALGGRPKKKAAR